MAFAGPAAARGWSAPSEVPATVPLIWAGRAVETAELYSPKSVFAYQECEPRRQLCSGSPFCGEDVKLLSET